MGLEGLGGGYGLPNLGLGRQTAMASNWQPECLDQECVLQIVSTSPGETFQLVSFDVFWLICGIAPCSESYLGGSLDLIVEGLTNGVSVATVAYPWLETNLNTWQTLEGEVAGVTIDELRITLPYSDDFFSGALPATLLDRVVLDKNPVSVPEPGTIALFSIGLAGMRLARRRMIV